MQNHSCFQLRFNGEFSLSTSVRVSAASAFVDEMSMEMDEQSPTLDLAFPVEGKWGSVGVRVRQQDDIINVEMPDNSSRTLVEDVRAQLERMFSLDIDASAFVDVMGRDPIVESLHRARPGLRPILYPSPYEAAARAIIGHRLFVRQAASVSARVSLEHGVAVTVGSRLMHAFPAPDKLASLPSVKGLSDRKVSQLRALGVFAAEGELTATHLRATQYPEALAYLQQLQGIGPFSAELIMLRGVGDADAFPLEEKRLHRAMGIAYKLGNEANLDALLRIAEHWRPYRSWVGLFLRNSNFAR